ncbi:hypothetical protein [Niveibacterium sp. SC-1]|uniref:hypothetical protein n=1 Tax=Niveibacterium sp. SC-1 TaxID=3135646 RepID=UPI00311D6B67
MTPYIGNGAYCYANSAAMLLAHHGYNISPGLLEVLSGVGLGAIYRRDPAEMFFSDPNGLPDAGIGKALEILGFSCGGWPRLEEGAAVPFAALENALRDGPVMIGPLDMGLLRYHPHWEWLGGADHYVLITGLNDRVARLHDPDAVPCAVLPRGELAEAWRAEKVVFRSGAFQAWHSPRRAHTPTSAEIHERARTYFRERCQGAAAAANDTATAWGVAAIRACGQRVREGDVPPPLHGMLIHFSLRLGARRALDYAAFFALFDAELARLKREQADVFGLAHCAAVRKEWARLADCFATLAELEAPIHARLCAG